MVGNAQAQGLESQDFAGHGQSSAGKGAECPATAVASADRSAIGKGNAALQGSRMRNATHPRSHAAADPQLHTKPKPTLPSGRWTCLTRQRSLCQVHLLSRARNPSARPKGRTEHYADAVLRLLVSRQTGGNFGGNARDDNLCLQMPAAEQARSKLPFVASAICLHLRPFGSVQDSSWHRFGETGPSNLHTV